MELKSLLLLTLLSLASATPALPIVKSFAPSKVVPREAKLKMPYPTTFYDLPTGDPRSVPLPTGELGSPPPPWRHEHGVGVYKDPNQIAPLWYSESEEGWGWIYPLNPGGPNTEDPAPTKTMKVVPRIEVATPTPTVLRDDTGFDVPLGGVSTQLRNEGEILACWNTCSQFGHEACERCDQKLRLGGLIPSTQPARYDPWGWSPKQARDSVDTAAVSMAFQMLWKCAINCMRDGATPCTTCDALWDESQKMVSSRGFKEELNFWVCVRDCSRDRLISCMECEPAWRKQLAMITPNYMSVEQAAASADIWNCAVHCDKDRMQKMCTPCDELWRKWDAGLPPFGPERTGLITAGDDDGSPSNPNPEDLAVRFRMSACMKGCKPANETRPTSYCKYCETLVRSASLLEPRPWIRRSISAEPSKTIAKRLLYVWDPVTGVFKCSEQCAKGKDYYESCLPCLYEKGVPVDGESYQIIQAEVVNTSPEQKSGRPSPA
ncbi:hypothetical protein GGP41_008258 [Bipolaris sorokiniana]|uniref:RanBP2-type domain-containing protein n=2 Tax=Cochliobolus sativus TaxID=45130 RepID=A0A8H6DY96_COCSA|nr:uncharacterized protein COCSADRAFT_303415 [Bipolaris sorokiniana ND90Pr]EMD66870.1 hypothetical protein COCSADRAFT_303415 [Bipolaris sorokiniana ND90Pr]KAF5852856.1 hypothetical protein GGP41_008258 [Bipolaris sorokiniana]